MPVRARAPSPGAALPDPGYLVCAPSAWRGHEPPAASMKPERISRSLAAAPPGVSQWVCTLLLGGLALSTVRSMEMRRAPVAEAAPVLESDAPPGARHPRGAGAGEDPARPALPGAGGVQLPLGGDEPVRRGRRVPVHARHRARLPPGGGPLGGRAARPRARLVRRARHLRDLHEQLGGWHVAAAAYNCGSGSCAARCACTAAALGAGELRYWRIRPYLPRETRDYVPKLLAAARIARKPAVFGFGGWLATRRSPRDLLQMRGWSSRPSRARCRIPCNRALNRCIVHQTCTKPPVLH